MEHMTDIVTLLATDVEDLNRVGITAVDPEDIREFTVTFPPGTVAGEDEKFPHFWGKRTTWYYFLPCGEVFYCHYECGHDIVGGLLTKNIVDIWLNPYN